MNIFLDIINFNKILNNKNKKIKIFIFILIIHLLMKNIMNKDLKDFVLNQMNLYIKY